MKAFDQQKNGYFHFDPEDPIYSDHFPGNPVVPGSMIIHAFIQAAVSHKMRGTAFSATRFRFKRFLPPGRYAFQMRPREDGRRDCILFDRDEAVVTGIL